MWKSRYILMMWGIIPSPLESAISLLPVYPVRQSLQGVRCRHHEFKSLQEVTVGEHRSEADKPLVRPFLAFPYLHGAYYRREEKRLFYLIEIPS